MTYVDRIDGIAGALAFKAPVRVATTANITLSGLQAIDGVTVVAGDRVLVKNQTTTSENGIYDANSSAWSRSKDFDGNRDATDGTLVGVRAGSANADKVYRLAATNPVVFGTSSLTFTAVLTFDSLPLPVSDGGTGVTTLDALKTALGLGTAAYLDVGTAEDDIVQFDAVGYPAADGSQITNLSGANITGGIGWPPNYLSGLTLSNAADVDHDITVAVGYCRNAANTANVTLASAITKRADATWAEGTGNGGAFPTTSLPTSGTYHMFLITKDADGTVDAGFDTSLSGANVPAGWTVARRIGSPPTDGSANFRPFNQAGDTFLLNTPVLAVDATNPGTSAVTAALTGLPTGIVVTAIVAAQLINGTTVTIHAYFSALASADLVPSNSAAPLAQLSTGGENAGRTRAGQLEIRTNTSAQIRYRISASSTNDKILIAVLGWIDTRGRLG